MDIVDPQIMAVVRRFLSLVNKHHPDHQAILFGSVARGESSSDSDIDVAIILDCAQGQETRIMLQLSDIAYDLLLEEELLISPIVIRLQDWQHPESFSNSRLLYNILKDGIQL